MRDAPISSAVTAKDIDSNPSSVSTLWGTNMMTDVASKKRNPSTREMTTPLFLLRCVELGIGIADLDLLTIGLVLDMWTEKSNDDISYDRMATQEDFDKF